MTSVYEAGRRTFRVRALTWFAMVCAAFAVWSGWGLLHTYGLRPADGGVLAPLPVRLAFGGFVAALGLAFLAGMALYGRCYIARMDYDRSSRRIALRTIGLLGDVIHVIDASDIVASRYHHGYLWTPRQTVNAPWTTIQVRGRRLPLVLDAQGRTLEPGLLRKLLR